MYMKCRRKINARELRFIKLLKLRVKQIIYKRLKEGVSLTLIILEIYLCLLRQSNVETKTLT